MDKQRQQDK